MNNHDYFVSAVIIALVVPLVIGGVYFVDVSEQKGKNTYLSSLDGKKDVVLLGDTKLLDFNPVNLINDDYSKGSFIDFEVKYAAGLDSYTEYDVSIQGIDFSPNIVPEDIAWKLMKYNDKTKEYEVISTGNFLTGETNMKVLESANIELYGKQKYRLHYYVSSRNNNYNRGTINASVTIE